MENVNQQAISPQNTIPSSAEPLQIKPRKKRFWLFLISGILILLVTAGFLGRNFLLKSQRNQPTSARTSSCPLKLSVLYAINKGRLQDHNYDTLVAESSQTYISDINRQNSQPVSIGYSYQNEVNRASKFSLQTTQDGKYLIRSTDQTIEIAPASQIESFTKIFETSNGKLGSFLVSQDGSKIVILYDHAGKKIAIQDLTNPQSQITVIPQRESDSYTIFGYDAKQRQIYWQRSEGPMTHYTELISLDDNGKIVKTKSINDYSFITEFDSQFQYAYYEGYGSERDGYKGTITQQNLQTGKKTTLVTLSQNDNPVNIKLSPTQDTLFFFNNAPVSGSNDANNKIYIINLLNNSVKEVVVPAGFTPTVENYISPDGKYLLLYNSLTCRNDACSDDIDHIVLYSIDTDQFYTYYQRVGIKESFQDDSNNYHNIETMSSFGWLATPRSEAQSQPLLPIFGLAQALATPTPNPVATGDYPFIQLDLSKNKKFYFSYNYPDDILNASSINLIGMKCAPRFSCDPPYDSCWYFDRGSITAKKVTEAESQFIKLVKEAAQSISGTQPTDQLANVTSCQTQAGDTILMYQSLGNADRSIGVGNGTDYIGFAPVNDTLTKVATIQIQSTAHACDSPIMLTRDFKFYFTCNAFDGPSIHKVDLKNATEQKLLSCSRDSYSCQ